MTLIAVPEAGAGAGAAQPAGGRGQVALGRALQRRAGEVADAVMHGWARRCNSEVLPGAGVAETVIEACTLATAVIGRFLATGQGARPVETAELAPPRSCRRPAGCP